jgi:murein L,D-transpeptidase YcbB/YkuD
VSCAFRRRKGEAEGKRSSERAPDGAWILGLALLAAACGGGDGGSLPPAEGTTLAVATVPTEPAGPPAPDVAATVEQALVAAEHPWLRWSEIPDVAPALAGLYEAEPDRLFWLAGETPYPAVKGALAELAGAEAHGLDPADYDATRLADEWASVESGAASARDRALFDLGLSVAVARLLSAAHVGRVDPATMDWGYDVTPKELDLAATLRDVRDRQGVAAALTELEPPFAHYTRARRTLAAYKTVAAAGEPEPVPELPKGQKTVEPGQPWAGVPQLAGRLRAFGDLADDVAASEVAPDGTPLYAGPLVEAVKRFQDRHGLEPDAVFGSGTLAAVNVPFAVRVRQLELAMERMRWLPKLATRPTVFVNVPLFRLWATDPETGQEPLRMNVVVGKSLNHRTPIFIEQMEYVIFRPYWNPPYGITVKEIVPHARRDPSYVEKQNFEIVASGDDSAPALPATKENLDEVVAGRLHIRQKPGPKNSLGLAKFIFPNAENVYMHGTPAQQLFSRARRDFSHGCIRLEDPARLGEWVLRDHPEWTRERIDGAMQGSRPTRVNLKEPLMVVLFYDTVHVNSEDVVFFVDDIYGHDAALDKALRRGYPYPTAAAAERS